MITENMMSVAEYFKYYNVAMHSQFTIMGPSNKRNLGHCKGSVQGLLHSDVLQRGCGLIMLFMVHH